MSPRAHVASLACVCLTVAGCGSRGLAGASSHGPGAGAVLHGSALGAGTGDSADGGARAGAELASLVGHRFFSPSSFWNSPVAAGAPLDPGSAAMVTRLSATVAAEQQQRIGPWINTTAYSVPVYTVSIHQPTVRVRLDRADARGLAAAWRRVPLPANARPAAGSDAHLVVWQPRTDRLWEFWRLRRARDGWHAGWGGAMRHVSRQSGVYGPAAWPGAKSNWGASACSLSIAGGLITLEDLRRGSIDHALAMAVPDVRAGFYASPARRNDGTSADPSSLPEGAHLRLDPNLDLASLRLAPLTLMIARAAQRYGIFVRDGARNVGFYAQDPVPTGRDPFRGADGYFKGSYPNELLSSFPWGSLQVLAMTLHQGRSGALGRFAGF